MPTQALKNLSRVLRRRLTASALLALLLVTPQAAQAEPLGYVLRPDRQDIGVLDSRDDSLFGGLPLSSALGNDIGRLNFIALNADGRSGLVGATEMGLGRLDLLSGRVDETLDIRGQPLAVGALSAVFRPGSNIAYVSLFQSGLLEVDTSDGRVEILRSFEAPNFLKLFYLPSAYEGVDLEDVDPEDIRRAFLNPLLFGLREDGRITAFDLELGREIGNENTDLRAQLARFFEVVDLTVEPDGSIWALTAQDALQHLPREGLDVQGFPIFRVPADLSDRADHFALGKGGLSLYLANSSAAFKLECPSDVFGPSDEAVAKPVAPCDSFNSRLVITEIELGEVTDDGEILPPETNNPIGDLALTPDEASLYVVGRRTIFRIDTEAEELTAGFRMRAGPGNSQLGQIALSETVEPCVPQSTSLLALRNEIDNLTTSNATRGWVRFRADRARSALLDGDVEDARSQLIQVIGRTTSRSNLSAGEANHIPPDEAASVICAAGNILERVRLQ